MAREKPDTIKAYLKWLRQDHGVSRTSLNFHYYTSVTGAISRTIKNSPFWQSLTSDFKRIGQDYYVKQGYDLFISDPPHILHIKPHDSFIKKTYRLNVLHNEKWDQCPTEGWILPGNWYSRINDVIRTYFVVKYLDGVKFLSDCVESHAAVFGLPYKVDYESKEEGYYAAHGYTALECEVPNEDWDTRRVTTTLEIQISTQLQDVIRSLLHKYYEDRRMKQIEEEIKWQWDYTSDEFSANYLGHILHYIEGMIMEIREKQKEDA